MRSITVVVFLSFTCQSLMGMLFLDSSRWSNLTLLNVPRRNTVEVAGWKAGRCTQLFLNDQDKAAISTLLLINEELTEPTSAPVAVEPTPSE